MPQMEREEPALKIVFRRPMGYVNREFVQTAPARRNRELVKRLAKHAGRLFCRFDALLFVHQLFHFRVVWEAGGNGLIVVPARKLD